MRSPDVPLENRFAAVRRHERLALTRPSAPRRPPSLQPPNRGRTPKLVYLLRPRLRRRRLDAALERILDPASSAPRRNTPNAPPSNLTRRQLEVLEIMATGATATEIASELNVKVNTVRTHIRAIIEALGVSRQTEAVARAVRDHLI
jgi:DNA-binding NarL/FixJ family response regulator